MPVQQLACVLLQWTGDCTCFRKGASNLLAGQQTVMVVTCLLTQPRPQASAVCHTQCALGYYMLSYYTVYQMVAVCWQLMPARHNESL
jgi:hypothetical protein